MESFRCSKIIIYILVYNATFISRRPTKVGLLILRNPLTELVCIQCHSQHTKCCHSCFLSTNIHWFIFTSMTIMQTGSLVKPQSLSKLNYSLLEHSMDLPVHMGSQPLICIQMSLLDCWSENRVPSTSMPPDHSPICQVQLSHTNEQMLTNYVPNSGIPGHYHTCISNNIYMYMTDWNIPALWSLDQLSQ